MQSSDPLKNNKIFYFPVDVVVNHTSYRYFTPSIQFLNYTHFTLLLVHCPYPYPILNLTPLGAYILKCSNTRTDRRRRRRRPKRSLYGRSARVSFLSNKYKYITRIERHSEVQFVADANIELKENIESRVE